MKEVLKIRETLPVTQSIWLGISPVFVILIIWSAVTWGSSEVSIIPEGLLEIKISGVKPGPGVSDVKLSEAKPGMVVDEGTYIIIAGGEQVTSEASGNAVVLNGDRFPLPGFYIKPHETGIKIRLPRGTFISREVKPSDKQNPGPIGRGSPQGMKVNNV
ncbi:hypothetical protein HYY75_12120, partial [bacterium]|nr:hypothetical protein [bacterium]